MLLSHVLKTLGFSWAPWCLWSGAWELRLTGACGGCSVLTLRHVPDIPISIAPLFFYFDTWRAGVSLTREKLTLQGQSLTHSLRKKVLT